ncbi:MAG: chitobiase/beta-hexosaminidase C-terminal domain-containing protein, partial [Spirochaetota bacterium]
PGTKTIKAIATKACSKASTVGSATYVISYVSTAATPTPTLSPAAGTYTVDTSVTIACTTDGAKIFYTTDGSDPTTASTRYSGAIAMAGHGTAKTIKAIAKGPANSTSAVGSAAYTITYTSAATPTFSPAGGSYTSDQTVKIASTTIGASIYYTTDGTAPTSSSTPCAGAISLAGNGTTTIKAIAIGATYSISAVGTATYVISYPPAASPTFSLVEGTYATAQSVTLSSATTRGATIYYTTDGSTPTTASTAYSGAISVPANAPKTLHAIATAPGYSPSAVATAAYNSLLALLPVAGGSFNNGTATVTLSPFAMSRYEVTQAQYLTVTGSSPSNASGSSYPVEKVTWYDAVEFCNKLSTSEGLVNVYTISGRTPATGYPITAAIANADFSKNGYRLPTEAEWEFAARGGASTHGYTYAGSNTITDVGWDVDNSYSGYPKYVYLSHQVGLKAANELGLFDMSGSVAEWCWDWYGIYPSGAQTDPLGANLGNTRICRGGGYYSSSSNCSVSSRNSLSPATVDNYTGFRVVRRPPF